MESIETFCLTSLHKLMKTILYLNVGSLTTPFIIRLEVEVLCVLFLTQSGSMVPN